MQCRLSGKTSQRWLHFVQNIPSCTTDGCNLTVYGLDGEFVGFTESDYDRALEAKYGKACTEWVERNKQANYTNDPQNQPAKLKECGSQNSGFTGASMLDRE